MKSQDNPSTTRSPQELQQRRAASLSPWEDMESFFDTAFPRDLFRFGRGHWPEWAGRLEAKPPAVDVIDRPEDILVRAAMPGVKKEDLEITVTENLVTIRGTTRQEEERKEEQYYRRELSRGEYSRSVTLPANVDSDLAKASFKDGILELSLPKITPTPRRSIKVE